MITLVRYQASNIYPAFRNTACTAAVHPCCAAVCALAVSHIPGHWHSLYTSYPLQMLLGGSSLADSSLSRFLSPPHIYAPAGCSSISNTPTQPQALITNTWVNIHDHIYPSTCLLTFSTLTRSSALVPTKTTSYHTNKPPEGHKVPSRPSAAIVTNPHFSRCTLR
jgi:hypothetical protein